jgi:hypothetical protein
MVCREERFSTGDLNDTRSRSESEDQQQGAQNRLEPAPQQAEVQLAAARTALMRSPSRPLLTRQQYRRHLEP